MAANISPAFASSHRTLDPADVCASGLPTGTLNVMPPPVPIRTTPQPIPASPPSPVSSPIVIDRESAELTPHQRHGKARAEIGYVPERGFEEGLRHGSLAAVVADVARLSMTASRRLHLAAKTSGTTGIALRRWRRQLDASDFGQPTAAMTRWRVSVLPSSPLPAPGVGRARWLVELLRARAGDSFDLELEACDGTGHLGLPAAVAGGSAAAAGRHAFG